MQDTWDSFFNKNVDTLRSNPTQQKKLSLKEQQALRQQSLQPTQQPIILPPTTTTNNIQSLSEEYDDFGTFHSASQQKPQLLQNTNNQLEEADEEWGDFQTVSKSTIIQQKSHQTNGFPSNGIGTKHKIPPTVNQPQQSSLPSLLDDPFFSSPAQPVHSTASHYSNHFSITPSQDLSTGLYSQDTTNLQKFIPPASTFSHTSVHQPPTLLSPPNNNSFISPPLLPNQSLVTGYMISPMVASPSINTPTMILSSPPVMKSPIFTNQELPQQSLSQPIPLQNANQEEDEWDDFTSASSIMNSQNTSNFQSNANVSTIVPPITDSPVLFSQPSILASTKSFSEIISEWIEQQQTKERIPLNSFIQITPQFQVLVMPCKSSRQLPLGLWQTNPTLLLLWIVLQECETIYQVLSQFIFSNLETGKLILNDNSTNAKLQNLLRAIPLFDQMLAYGVEFVTLPYQDIWMKQILKYKHEQWKREVMNQIISLNLNFNSEIQVDEGNSSVCSIIGMPVPTNELIFWKQRIMHVTCKNLFIKHGII